MIKLFIEPRHGYLGKVIDALKQANFEAKVIGWGYPPIYVEAEEKQLKEIEEIVLLEDNLAKFQRYRVDFVDITQLPAQLRKYCSLNDMRDIAFALNIDHAGLPGGGVDTTTLSLELVRKCQQTKREADLIRVVHSTAPYAVEEIIRDPAGQAS
jgi:hypothetical protein